MIVVAAHSWTLTPSGHVLFPKPQKKIRPPGNKGGKGVFAYLKGMPVHAF
jgi:hypothetical protein